MSTAAQLGYAEHELEDLLDAAQANAVDGKAMDFVDDMQKKFKQYKTQLFMTEPQESWLKKLARVDD